MQTLRKWLTPDPADAEAMAESKRLEDDKLTVRISQAGISQSGRPPYGGIPPTPDLMDPDREHR